MAEIKTLATLPRFSKLVRVAVMNIEMTIEENCLEAYADIEAADNPYRLGYEFGALMPASGYEAPRRRRGRVRISIDAVNELSQDKNFFNYYMVEDSHIEWEN